MRFGGGVSGEIPVHLMRTCWLTMKMCANISQGWTAVMLLAAGTMPSTFIWSGDGHTLQHGAVSLAGRMPITEFSICLDTLLSLLERKLMGMHGHRNSSALEKNTSPVVYL